MLVSKSIGLNKSNRLSEFSRRPISTKVTKQQVLPIPVWIDCDPGHDDAFALLLATHSPEIELLGVSVVHGNDHVENCGLNAKRFLWTCGVHGIPVYLGADRPLIRNPKFCPEIHGVPGEQGVSGLCGFHFPDDEIFSNPEYKINEGHGVLKMMECIMKHTQKVTIVATGAQTNVALLLRMFPDVVSKNVDRIIFMGGSIGLGNTSVAAEFNIEIDPEAAHIVFHSGIPLVMIPLEVTHTVLLTDEILNSIKEADQWNKDKTINMTTQGQQLDSPHRHFEYEVERLLNSATKKAANSLKDETTHVEPIKKNEDGKSLVSPFLNCCYQLLIFFKSTYKEVFSFESPPLHDPCTIFYLTNPEAFQTLPVFVDVDISSEKCCGRTLVDVYNTLKREPNVLICTRVNTTKFWQKMLQCLQIANTKSPLNKIVTKESL